MIDMGLLRVIRLWALRKKMPIRENARRTGLSRNTIKKYLRAGIVEPQFQSPDWPVARQHMLACVGGKQAGSVCGKAGRLADGGTAQIAQGASHKGALDVPIAGSEGLLLAGTAVCLFAAASIGVLLGIVARTMAQFALLIMLVIMPIMILSGGMSSIESRPIWLQPITWLLPSRHYMDFATAIAYRGADFSIVWPEFLWTFGLGAGFLAVSLILFRRSVAGG